MAYFRMQYQNINEPLTILLIVQLFVCIYDLLSPRNTMAKLILVLLLENDQKRSYVCTNRANLDWSKSSRSTMELYSVACHVTCICGVLLARF
jgi:hypothetical protein